MKTIRTLKDWCEGVTVKEVGKELVVSLEKGGLMKLSLIDELYDEYIDKYTQKAIDKNNKAIKNEE